MSMRKGLSIIDESDNEEELGLEWEDEDTDEEKEAEIDKQDELSKNPLMMSLSTDDQEARKAKREDEDVDESIAGTECDEDHDSFIGWQVQTKDGREGVVIEHDPGDVELEIKIKFSHLSRSIWTRYLRSN